jgi:hypothetical protein
MSKSEGVRRIRPKSALFFTCSQLLLMACLIAPNHTPKDKEPTIPAKRSISLGIDPGQRDFISC